MDEPNLLQIKGIEESVNKANVIFLEDVVIQGIREECHLIPVEIFNIFVRNLVVDEEED